MKLNRFFTLAGLAISLISNASAQQMDAREQQLSEDMQQQMQQQAQEVMQRMTMRLLAAMHDLLIAFYEKNYDSIVWLEKNYISDTNRGDILIDKLVKEFEPILNQVLRELIQILQEESQKQQPAMRALVEQNIAQINTMYKELMSEQLRQGFKEQASIRSTVYQRRNAKK